MNLFSKLRKLFAPKPISASDTIADAVISKSRRQVSLRDEAQMHVFRTFSIACESLFQTLKDTINGRLADLKDDNTFLKSQLQHVAKLADDNRTRINTWGQKCTKYCDNLIKQIGRCDKLEERIAELEEEVRELREGRGLAPTPAPAPSETPENDPPSPPRSRREFYRPAQRSLPETPSCPVFAAFNESSASFTFLVSHSAARSAVAELMKRAHKSYLLIDRFEEAIGAVRDYKPFRKVPHYRTIHDDLRSTLVAAIRSVNGEMRGKCVMAPLVIVDRFNNRGFFSLPLAEPETETETPEKE